MLWAGIGLGIAQGRKRVSITLRRVKDLAENVSTKYSPPYMGTLDCELSVDELRIKEAKLETLQFARHIQQLQSGQQSLGFASCVLHTRHVGDLRETKMKISNHKMVIGLLHSTTQLSIDPPR